MAELNHILESSIVESRCCMYYVIDKYSQQLNFSYDAMILFFRDTAGQERFFTAIRPYYREAMVI